MAWKTTDSINSSNNSGGIISPKQWIEYYSNFLRDHTDKYQHEEEIGENEAMPEITEEDIHNAKNNKSPGLGNIRMELFNNGRQH